jgi:hypothetical protein
MDATTVAQATETPTIYDMRSGGGLDSGLVRNFAKLVGFEPAELPPLERIPAPLRDVAQRHGKLVEDWRAVRARLRTEKVKADAAEAAQADIAAGARALLAGKADPGRKAAEKLKAEVEELERRRDVLVEAIRTVERDLGELMSINRDELVEAEAAAVLDGVAALERLFDAIGPLVYEVACRASVATWLASEGGQKRKAARMPRKPYVDGVEVDNFLAALRAWTQRTTTFHTRRPARSSMSAAELGLNDPGPDAA